ncbi:MAG: hypothetical protein HY822_25170 [Acidobacteria bacterium]|nr:hypothetical protein [Acidobacteriota bacterium]
MKQLILALAMVGIFTAACFAVEAHAVKTRVPFDFTVGSTQVPAGVYTVEPQGLPGVLMLRDSAGHVAAMFQINRLTSASENPDPRLVFNKYGDRYFLARVWDASGTGSELRKTKTERELLAFASVEQVLVAAFYR